MSTKKPIEVAWTVYRLRKTPAEYVGRVYARDSDTAIAKAIEEFKITDREQQKRLIAQRA
jgi:hypothetical protein